MRITEPRVKVSYVFWLVEKGAKDIRVLIDGAEPECEIVAEKLISRGYTRQPLAGSKKNWTGHFSKNEVHITVSSRPGIDIEAYFPNGKALAAECKGEPTPKGVKSGTDLTALYTALGQLLITSDAIKATNLALVVPDTLRLRAIVTRNSQNIQIKKLGVGISLVNESGEVEEITPNLA